jgi:hypothetical protein
MSWKPEFLIDGVWYDNAVRFATEAEAIANAKDKFSKWTMPTDYRSVESPDPANYRWTESGLEEVQ